MQAPLLAYHFYFCAFGLRHFFIKANAIWVKQLNLGNENLYLPYLFNLSI